MQHNRTTSQLTLEKMPKIHEQPSPSFYVVMTEINLTQSDMKTHHITVRKNYDSPVGYNNTKLYLNHSLEGLKLGSPFNIQYLQFLHAATKSFQEPRLLLLTVLFIA